MKIVKYIVKASIILLVLLQYLAIHAQVPQKVSYQMIVRNHSGELVKELLVGVRVSILQGSSQGSAVYVETHAPQSNINGLVSLEIGAGTPGSGTFAGINWANGPYFLQIETDPSGGSNYSVSGASEILSVPYSLYALHAQTADAMKKGNNAGEILFWDGEQWVSIPPGDYDQALHICNGVPTWGPCPPTIPAITTWAVTGIGQTEANSGGTIVHSGNANITARGLVWNTSPEPTLGNKLGMTAQGSGAGTFTSSITGLSPQTTYFVRAYATNSYGTAYGNQIEFSTQAQTVFLATISTSAVSNLTKNSATSGGNITNNGGAAINPRGVVWCTSTMPTLENKLGHTTDGTGDGAFTSQIENLTPNTKYYIRAYAVNSMGVAYGNQYIINTLTDAALPTVVTSEVGNIELTSASGGGNVTSDGGSEILARGICWGKNESPTFNDNYITSGTGTGSFVAEMENLEIGTKYYVRAYATNAAGIGYGNQVEFSTLTEPPTVIIVNYNFGQPGVNFIDGEVLADGGEQPTARGFVWGTGPQPTVDGYDGIFVQEEGLGQFSTEITELEPNTVYHLRAFATNAQGTAYSDEMLMPFWDYHGYVSDYDGNTYQTVKIGNQVWMTENLKTTHYKNGIPIANVTGNAEWAALNTAAFSWPDNNPDNANAFGALYNWFTTQSEHGVCPTGWHVPTGMEWESLTHFLHNRGYSNVWDAIRSQSGWTGDVTKFNSSGFSALPSRIRTSGGGYTNATSTSSDYWWSSTASYDTESVSYRGGYTNNWTNKRTGLIIRCVKDYEDAGEGTVMNHLTGRVWMDRNLGASRVATSSTDEEAYGDLYQWGRAADGHEKRNSATTSTLSTSDTPGHGDFILNNEDANYDWRIPQNTDLWHGVNGTNNPCPSGYRLPTIAEWEAEFQSWGSNNNSSGVYNSPLKLPMAGYRYYYNGSFHFVGSGGRYWSSTVDGILSQYLNFYSGDASTRSSFRTDGKSVRCIKD